MTEHRFTDAASITGARITNDGYLVGEVRCARTGCQDYLGSEMGVPERPRVTVYRPEAAVFAKDSLATFAGKPVTVGHPAENVTADNWRDHAVGDIGDEIARDGEFVKVPFRLMDAAAIRAVEAGTREVSMGYTTPISLEDGIAPDGTPYQAIQTGPIRINHLALVAKARGGASLRIGDGADHWGASPITMSDNKEDHMSDALKTVVLGDEAAQVAVADAAKVEAFKAAMTKKVADMETSHAAAIAAKDAEIAKKDAALDAEKAKVLSDADLDKRVAARADLVGKARAIVADVKVEGLSDTAIRKAVVVAKFGDAAITGKSEAYVDARFDLLVEDASKAPDVVADALKQGTTVVDARSDATKARGDQLSTLRDAWKGTAAAQH